MAQRKEEFDLDSSRGELEKHVRLILGAFGADLARQPPMHYPPMPKEDRVEYLKDAVRLAARRYGVDLAKLFVRFTSVRRGQEAGSFHQTSAGSFVDVLEEYRDHDAAVTAVAAHEVAHYALTRRGLAVPDSAENERLTDTLMVMAGYGPMMLDIYHQEFSGQMGDQFVTNVFGFGYLHPTAVAYLSLLQLEIAHLPPEEHIPKDSPWYSGPWEQRRDLESASRSGRMQICYVCGEPLRLPESGARGLVPCAVCRIVQPGATTAAADGPS